MTEIEYRQFVSKQRGLALRHVDKKLDELCERNGFKAGDWRRWKMRDMSLRLTLSAKKFTDGIEKLNKSLSEITYTYNRERGVY